MALTNPLTTWFYKYISGFNPVQVTLRNRSDSSPVQDSVVNKHSNSLVVNLSRPPPPSSDTTFIIGSQPTGHITGDEQSEFPEGM